MLNALALAAALLYVAQAKDTSNKPAGRLEEEPIVGSYGVE